MVVRIKWALGYALLHFFTLFYFAVLKNIMLAYWLTVNILRNILSSYNVLQVDELRRSSLPEVFLRKGALKICSKFTGEHPCRSVTSIKLLFNLLKSHVDMGVFLQICCIFSEHLFLKRPLDGCFFYVFRR